MSNLAFAESNPDRRNEKKAMFSVINGTGNTNDDSHQTKRKSNNTGGVSTEVYAFRTQEEIKKMIDVFNKHIENSVGTNRQIACRNKMMFLMGLNIGIRASDLRSVKWSFFYKEDENGNRSFKESYKIQPQKQRKAKKFITMFFNDAVKKAIENYVNEYPIDDIDSYVFFSRKGGEPISTRGLWRIIKDTAKEAGIEQNIGSHSLRKSFGYWAWHEAQNKEQALVILQACFNHSDTRTTMKYIGLLDTEIQDMYNSVNLGLGYI